MEWLMDLLFIVSLVLAFAGVFFSGYTMGQDAILEDLTIKKED